MERTATAPAVDFDFDHAATTEWLPETEMTARAEELRADAVAHQEAALSPKPCPHVGCVKGRVECPCCDGGVVTYEVDCMRNGEHDTREERCDCTRCDAKGFLFCWECGGEGTVSVH